MGILHQLVKMKAFIVISFALASLVAAAPDSSSGSDGSDRFLGDLIHNVIDNVFGEHGHGESSFGSGSMDDVGSWDMPSSWDMGSESFDPWDMGTSGTSGTSGTVGETSFDMPSSWDMGSDMGSESF